MARTYVRLPVWRRDTFGVDVASYDTFVLAARDALRTALDPGETNNDWIVGDVIRWDGSGAADGYAFIVRHMNGSGVATGPEWLFVIPGRGPSSSGTAEFEDIFANGVDADIDDWWIAIDGSVTFGGDGSWGIHYNPDGGTSTPYDGGNTWDAVGAVTGGDLSAPTSSPWTAEATFFPASTQIRGFEMTDFLYEETRCALVFDDQKPAVCLYAVEGRQFHPSTVVLSGEILDPYLGTDTFKSANLGLRLTNTSSQAGQISSQMHLFYDGTGTAQTATGGLNRPSYYTRQNETFASGEFAWDSAALITSTLFKGYYDSDLVKAVGAFNDRYMELFEFDGNVLLKAEKGLAFPYASSVPIFPAE